MDLLQLPQINDNNERVCPFCKLMDNQLAILPHGLNVKTKIRNKILFKANDLVIIPDIAPIIPYHLLIISSNHYFSCKSFNTKTLSQLIILKKEISSFFKNTLNSFPLYFEHGGCSDNEKKSACINHAHLHAIPFSKNDFDHLLHEIISIIGSPNYQNELTTPSYFYLEFLNNSYYWNDDSKNKQFFRKILSTYFSEPNRRFWQLCLYEEGLEVSVKWETQLQKMWNEKRIE